MPDGWLLLLVPAAAFLAGLSVAPHLGSLRRGWLIGGGLTLLPPAAWVALYAAAARTGCSGGDCMGPMIGMLLLGVPVVLVSLLGAGVLVRTLVRTAARAIGA